MDQDFVNGAGVINRCDEAQAPAAPRAGEDSYGKPTVTLAELRARVDSELGKLSFTELTLQERAAGW